MYSVEEEEKQKSEEKPDEDPAVTSPDDNEDKTFKDAQDRTLEAEKAVGEREEDIETTEYDISTDDDSLRMIYSSTDQVIMFIRCNVCFSWGTCDLEEKRIVP